MQLAGSALARGFSKTESAVFVTRKLARVAWAIYTKQQPYNEHRVLNQPSAKHNTDLAAQTVVVYAPANPRDKQIANAVLAAARCTRTSVTTQSDKPKLPHLPKGGS